MEAKQEKGLPDNVRRVLTEFVEATRAAFRDDLRAVVLYGSAAEGRLRATSDVNVLVVLSVFEQEKADLLREPFRVAQAAIRLTAMFLLETEMSAAMGAFAVKFADIARRHTVLYGDDPFANVSISRDDAIIRLRQTLLNLELRLRQTYIERSLREEQIIAAIADAAGPLRSCAAMLLELEGEPEAVSPREALERVAASLPDGAERARQVARISDARQQGTLAPGVAAPTLFHLIDLTHLLWTRACALS